MTLDDAEHFTAEQRAEVIPALGSGRVYPVADEAITVELIPIPTHWAQLAALDFGWDHPTAAIKLAHDRDSDIVYVTAAYRRCEATPIEHCAALKGWNAPVWAWPHDEHDKQSGKELRHDYEEHGLNMLAKQAQFEDGGNGVEAGVILILERMQSGQLKVFSHLTDWFDEFRLYHRKDGLIVKLRDDLMAATRYGIMCLRFAEHGLAYEEQWQRLEQDWAQDGPYPTHHGSGWMM